MLLKQKNMSFFLLTLFFSTFYCYAAGNTSVKGNDITIPFIKNVGQLRGDVQFYTQTFGGTVLITDKNNIKYQLFGSASESNSGGTKLVGFEISESFVNGNINNIKGKSLSKSSINSFIGNNEQKWQHSIPCFKTIDLGEVFLGINVELKATSQNVEKLFYVESEGRVSDIKIKINGAESLSINNNNELVVTAKGGEVAYTSPVAYQFYGGKRYDIEIGYELNKESYGFRVGDYNKNELLVIDPLLASSYIGGSGKDDDYEPGIAVDSKGNVFITGYTLSNNFPCTGGSFDESFGGGETDRFVSKFNSDLTELLASTYIGGNGDEFGNGIVIDKEDNVYLAGYTSSRNFPITLDAYDKSNNGYQDAFVVKLNNDLDNLIHSTYYGGKFVEGPYFQRIDIVIGSDGAVYIAGLTNSNDLPMLANSYQKQADFSSIDLFVTKFNNELTKLLGATYLGGNTNEYRPNLLLDNDGNVFIGGDSAGDYPTTPGAAIEEYPGGDYTMTISKLSGDLSALLASTYLGGIKEEDLLGMRFDSDYNLYVVGYSTSRNFPVSNAAFDKTYNGNMDGTITLLSNDLSTILASSYLGGLSQDKTEDIVVDKDGLVYVVNSTYSNNFPTMLDAYDKTYNGAEDVTITKFSADLTEILGSTYFGSNAGERGQAIAFGKDDNIYIVGRTSSRFFPVTQNAYGKTYNGGENDCFIAKFDKSLSNNPVSVDEEYITTEFKLLQNYPNPFNPTTKIEYSIQKSGNVSLKVYDMLSREIKVLVNEHQNPGKYVAEFNSDEFSYKLASGLYFYQLQFDNKLLVKKMLLLK